MLSPSRPVALVRDFVNTLDVDGGADSIAAPDELASWLRARALLSREDTVTPGDVAAAALLRDALRTVLRAHDERPAPEAEVGRINALVTDLRLVVRFDSRGGAAVEPGAAGAPGALAGILAAVASAVADGTWGRLKVCAERSCEWAFIDRSRNRSARWCSMAVCGNRTKTRNYRRRRASAPREAASPPG